MVLLILEDMKFILFFLILFFSFFSGINVFASDSNGAIDPSYRYAWGENLGWLNFACTGCNVRITDTGLTGYAWSKQYGWINLSPANAGVTNNCLGELGGKAWSSRLGWVDFTGISIDFNGKFTGQTSDIGLKSGRLSFSCTNCDVRTDWRQCSLRHSPPQVKINSITDNTVPTILANVIISNEGSVGTEYQYEWCVVTSESNACGGNDDIYYSLAAKFIDPSTDWTTDLTATVPNAGNYWFKLVAYYGEGRSLAAQTFTAVSSGGGGGGGGGGGSTPPISLEYYSADFNRDHLVNSIDFSILLYYWKTAFPFKNIYVDINKDNKVDSVDFSILLSQWGKK
jgi:hypothetical protein